MIQKVGNNSMIFEKPPVILAASSVVGEKEGQGPLGQYFDHVEKDPKFGMETWEFAMEKKTDKWDAETKEFAGADYEFVSEPYTVELVKN